MVMVYEPAVLAMSPDALTSTRFAAEDQLIVGVCEHVLPGRMNSILAFGGGRRPASSEDGIVGVNGHALFEIFGSASCAQADSRSRILPLLSGDINGWGRRSGRRGIAASQQEKTSQRDNRKFEHEEL